MTPRTKAWTIGLRPWFGITLMIGMQQGVHVQLALRIFTEEITFGISHWNASNLRKKLQ